MRLNSLAFRLFATAAAWTLVVLPIAGVIIYSLYRQDAEASFNDRLRTLLTVVLADSTDHAGTEPGAPRDVGESLFEFTHSGWYWQIKPVDGTQGRRQVSTSLATGTLPSPYEDKIRPDQQDMRWVDAKGPVGEPIRVVEMVYALEGDEAGPRYAYAVAGPLEWLETRVSVFRARLAIALALAGIGLLAVTLLQVHIGLLPLRAIEHGLAAIRSGDAAKLEGELPAEIEQLQHELNALIESNQATVDRARTQVGNLAHALKTPLTVITNEAREVKGQLSQKVTEQAEIMRHQVDYYLSRARLVARAGAIGRVSEVKPVVESLKRALERIYGEKGITIALAGTDGARFQGEQQDLEEMLGNLLDNACKWAHAKVYLTVAVAPAGVRGPRRQLTVVIEDDGPGLTEEERRSIGKRGLRLDETMPGSGLGLSIVNDLAQSYKGSLELAASRHGGLSATLRLPAA